MKSIWSMTEALPDRDPLPGSITVDTAVIGGGMAGILTAYQLQRRGVEAVVLEADKVGSGQTKNTTAKITSQHSLIYSRLVRQFGAARAREYAKANQEAIEEYERIVREEGIDCNFQRLPACLYTQGSGEDLRREWEDVRRLGIQAELSPVEELPISGALGLWFPQQAQFHPLKFLKEVSQKITVFEKTRVLRVEPNTLVTDRGAVSARRIIFATHFPFVNFPGFYFMRMHQERSYVLTLEGPPELRAIYYGTDASGLSLRSAEGALLVGGSSHRTGEGPPENAYEALRRKARALWPGSRETAAWSAQDCMTLDGVPYVGRFSPTRPHWYVAAGFNKWGMTGSMAAALRLAQLFTEGVEGERSVFSPRRFVISASLSNAGKEALKSGKGLLKEVFYFPGKEFDSLVPGQGEIIRWSGKKRGAYKDERGAVYLVSTRCPHLGCQLEWNGTEKTWDCPCHGSRFTYRGQLLDDPAQTFLSETRKL